MEEPQNSYQDATRYLTGRYATDTAYYAKLNRIIEQYGLTKYDNDTATALLLVLKKELLQWRTIYSSSR